VNTSTLKVGQEVYISSDPYYSKGTVVKVSPQGADVQDSVGEIFQFDCLGNSRDGHRTFEGGSWQITGTVDYLQYSCDGGKTWDRDVDGVYARECICIVSFKAVTHVRWDSGEYCEVKNGVWTSPPNACMCAVFVRKECPQHSLERKP